MFWNLIKSEDEMMIQIRDFSINGNKTWRQIHRIKNHLIWIKIHGKIIEWREENLPKNKIAKNQNWNWNGLKLNFEIEI